MTMPAYNGPHMTSDAAIESLWALAYRMGTYAALHFFDDPAMLAFVFS